MAEGDVLMAATDGLSEARNPAGDMFGQARLTAVLADLADRSAEALAEGLLLAVEHFAAGRPPEDDRTLVTLKSAAP
jgi:sigma-B regulation protein RsbU (phosphoserine phosphatase)